MAINYNPFSQFNVEPSSFSLPAGMDMNQAATMNAMMQPVSLLGQQGVSAPQSNFRLVTEADLVGTDGMSASQIVDMLNQPDYQTPSFSSDALLAGLGLGGAAFASQTGRAPALIPQGNLSTFAQRVAANDAARLAAQNRPVLIGTGASTSGVTNPRLVPGTRIVPTGQPPAVTSFSRPMVNVTGSAPQLSLPGSTAAAASGASRLARFGSPGTFLYGGADLLTELITGRGLSERIGEGVGGAVGDFLFPGATYLPPFTNAGTLAELAEMSAPVDRDRDPIRATYQLGPDYNNETIMERESGEIFAPSASQLEAFMDGMESMSQPTATGIGLGGSEGVVFGGGQPPMTQDETRAMLQERFGAPTISAIQNLPSGQGMGMMTDAQGRMISQGDDRSAFNQASRDRLARLEERDVRPGETLQERDTRIADSRTEGTDRGGKMSFEEARKFIPKGAKEKTKDYNARVKAFQAQQNSAISQLKEQYEQFRVKGQVLNNKRIQAYTAQYQQTEPEKFKEVVKVAQEMLNTKVNGKPILEDETQAAMYIIQQMGGKVSDIFIDSGPTPTPPANGNKVQLDKQTARAILEETGGDVEEARRIAIERGFVL